MKLFDLNDADTVTQCHKFFTLELPNVITQQNQKNPVVTLCI